MEVYAILPNDLSNWLDVQWVQHRSSMDPWGTPVWIPGVLQYGSLGYSSMDPCGTAVWIPAVLQYGSLGYSSMDPWGTPVWIPGLLQYGSLGYSSMDPWATPVWIPGVLQYGSLGYSSMDPWGTPVSRLWCPDVVWPITTYCLWSRTWLHPLKGAGHNACRVDWVKYCGQSCRRLSLSLVAQAECLPCDPRPPAYHCRPSTKQFLLNEAFCMLTGTVHSCPVRWDDRTIAGQLLFRRSWIDGATC